jgi:hypothetical protein
VTGAAEHAQVRHVEDQPHVAAVWADVIHEVAQSPAEGTERLLGAHL